MISVTYISKDRANHLKRSVESLFEQTVKPEHIIITDCSDDKISIELTIEELKRKSSIPITYIWKSKEELSRAQGRSIGRQYVKTPLAVSTESDIIFPPTLIEECLKEFGDPPQKIYFQTLPAFENQNGDVIKSDYCNNGFFQAYRVEDFDAIGGFNPLLAGWGWEDCDFTERIIEFGCKHVISKLYVTHIWHKVSADIENCKKNEKIAKKCYWNSDIKKFIYDENRMSRNIGSSIISPVIEDKKIINENNANIGYTGVGIPKIGCWEHCNKRKS